MVREANEGEEIPFLTGYLGCTLDSEGQPLVDGG